MDNDPTTQRAKERVPKATTTTTTAVDTKEATTTTVKEKGKDQQENGQAVHHYHHTAKEEEHQKENETTSCVTMENLDTPDKCWWKGQIYNIDQSQPVWSIPKDNQPPQLQQLPQSSASTTIMTQPQQTRLENINLYETGSFHTGVLSISSTTLIMGSTHRHWNSDKCGFTHIPTKPLRQQDPQTLTAINGEDIHIYGIKEVTLVHDILAIPATFIICDVNCAILGLDTITKNKLQLRVEGYRGHLARDHAEAQLDYIGHHFYLKALIFDGLYDYVDYTPDFAN
eukprot:5470351-Amphidinium_carterae.1